jgi:hypothetical protein
MQIAEGLDFGKNMLTFHLSESNTFKMKHPPSYFRICINLPLRASALITVAKHCA